mmetsp:Transcript_56823/g.139476  ORF Transcript_56823/g.139476 Transcript_56823/m.139476 type:complete len:235 (-) Transcript_56823:870-1574(-)
MHNIRPDHHLGVLVHHRPRRPHAEALDSGPRDAQEALLPPREALHINGHHPLRGEEHDIPAPFEGHLAPLTPLQQRGVASELRIRLCSVDLAEVITKERKEAGASVLLSLHHIPAMRVGLLVHPQDHVAEETLHGQRIALPLAKILLDLLKRIDVGEDAQFCIRIERARRLHTERAHTLPEQRQVHNLLAGHPSWVDVKHALGGEECVVPAALEGHLHTLVGCKDCGGCAQPAL